MRGDWEIKRWEDVLEIRSGRNQKDVENPDGKYPIYGSGGTIMNYADDYLCEEGTTIIGRKGTIDNPLFIETKFWNVDTAFGLVAGEKLDKRYLYYFCLSFDFTSRDKGTTLPSLVKKDLKKIVIPIPPLPEQKRIVAILDEAFEAIDQAKTNIERNIENAEELFQSKLNEIFSQRGKGWVTEKLSNVFRMKSGDQLSKKNVIPGPYPVYGGNGITAHHKEYNLEGQQVLIGRVGAQCGNVHLTDEKIWLTDNAFRVTDLKYEFDFEFLEHLLRVKDLRQTARQSAQPVISNSSCKNVQLDFPESITQQKEIAELVNALDSEVLQVIEVYKTKLLALEELKKSILQKAFSGELTVNEHVAA